MRSSISILIVALIAMSFACSKAANVSTSNANSNSNASANSTTANANKPEPAATAATDSNPTGSLATPTEAYNFAYAMREKKDLAGMKRVLSKDVQEFLTMMAEDGKTLDDQIKEMFDKPKSKSSDSRNEKINGDRATIEYLDDEGAWKIMDFVKEDGEWKMALPPDEELKIETGPPAKKPK